ncbi:MAG: glycosyltransferase family 2 protein [Eggerthellaceae bacterium]|jgi:GT2 family glycosyltransferase|nr:glycosyltransferase family 2 protein [Eggerthellaceae bacterium]MCH4220375.1 glycosyltransferase family 2 protein [Eggerthellaceae bacterium]
MKLYIGNVCRGEGEIYASVTSDMPLSNLSLSATSQTQDGKRSPVKLLSSGLGKDKTYVVMVPIVSYTQIVSVKAVDQQGAQLAEVTYPFKHVASAIQSRVHSVTESNDVQRIRNCDRYNLVNETRVLIDDVIADGDRSIVQGEVTFFVDDPSLEDTPIEIETFDSAGHRVNIGDWICIKDTVRPRMDYPNFRKRTIQFSLVIPASVQQFGVWGYSPTFAVTDGFKVIESWLLRDKRQAWWCKTLNAQIDPNYDHWFKDHRVNEQDLAFQREESFSIAPLYSIIVPLYKTPLPFLRDMAESVLNQTYDQFELILVNASPEDQELAKEVKAYQQQDKRVKVVNLDENRGITENTNEGIRIAQGDFLCFLDHDDILEPNALYVYTEGLQKYPDTDLLYCDEDKLKDGEYVSPYLKPDFNIDLLRGSNYVCHFLTVRKSVFDTLEYPTRVYDGAQDYHMTLRIAEKARNIFHARHVLYHWRIHANSTAASIDTKPYVQKATLRCLNEHLQRCGIPAKAVPSKRAPLYCELEYDLTEKPPVSIVIPNKDNVPVLARCISSIEQLTTYPNYEIVIVENNSTDKATFAYYDSLTSHKNIRIVKYEGPFNFAKIINFGIAQASYDYLLMLNNDTEVITPDWLERMMGPCMREDIGVVGARLLFPDRTIQHAGVAVLVSGPDHLNHRCPSTQPGYFCSAQLSMDLSAVTGACLLTKRSVFNQVNGLDEAFEVDYNDIDYCLRLREKGYLILLEMGAELIHHESVSRGHHVTEESALRFARERGMMMQRWPQFYAKGDPYMNPNFKPSSIYGALFWPDL